MDFTIANLQKFSISRILDFVPPSLHLVFYLFVRYICKNLGEKKLRFHNHMNSIVKSNIRMLAFKDNNPMRNLSLFGLNGHRFSFLQGVEFQQKKPLIGKAHLRCSSVYRESSIMRSKRSSV